MNEDPMQEGYERRAARSCRDEAASVLKRLHHFSSEGAGQAYLTLAELKVLGAAEETLREIIRRLS